MRANVKQSPENGDMTAIKLIAFRQLKLQFPHISILWYKVPIETPVPTLVLVIGKEDLGRTGKRHGAAAYRNSHSGAGAEMKYHGVILIAIAVCVIIIQVVILMVMR